MINHLNIQSLISDERCYDQVRQLRWPEKVHCPHCESEHIIRRGKDEAQVHRQRYKCKGRHKRFDDLTETVFAGHHQPLKTWMLCLYFMGLDLFTSQIAQELNINKDDAQQMTLQLCEGIVKKTSREVIG